MDLSARTGWIGLLLGGALVVGCTATPSAEIVSPDQASDDVVSAAVETNEAEGDPWRSDHLAVDGADLRAAPSSSHGGATDRWSPACLTVDGADLLAVLDDGIGAPCVVGPAHPDG